MINVLSISSEIALRWMLQEMIIVFSISCDIALRWMLQEMTNVLSISCDIALSWMLQETINVLGISCDLALRWMLMLQEMINVLSISCDIALWWMFQNTKFFILENAFERVVCQIGVHFVRGDELKRAQKHDLFCDHYKRLIDESYMAWASVVEDAIHLGYFPYHVIEYILNITMIIHECVRPQRVMPFSWYILQWMIFYYMHTFPFI